MGKVLTQPPIVVDAEILSACGRSGIPDEPVFVQITPDPAARVNKCVYNVDAAFSAGRGTAVLGWKIHIWPGVLVEFVGHAVLLSGGLLRCVTPDRYGDTKILFATDPRLSFDLQDPMARMPTRRIASTEHEDVAAFIRADEMNAIRRTHRPRPGEVLITGTDADRFRRLERLNAAPSVISHYEPYR
jgi:hypothetical protein